jgi:hypothetical protein
LRKKQKIVVNISPTILASALASFSCAELALGAVADPVGSIGRPRTTHKFDPKFYYYSSETSPRSLSSQLRPKTP